MGSVTGSKWTVFEPLRSAMADLTGRFPAWCRPGPGPTRRGQGRRAASAHQGRETETASGWVPFNQSPSPVTKNIYFLRLSRPIANLRFRRPLLTIRLSDQRLLCPREQARPYHRPVSARHARPCRRGRHRQSHRRRHPRNSRPADSPARDRRAGEPPAMLHRRQAMAMRQRRSEYPGCARTPCSRRAT